MNVQKWKKSHRLSILLCLCILLDVIGMPNYLALAAQRGVCTANMLMIRTGPGTGYDTIVVNGEEAYLTKNQVVEILDSKDGWYYLKAEFRKKQVTGYSLGKYIQIVSDTNTSTKEGGVCTANVLMVRTGPGLNYDKIEVNGSEAYLTKGQSIEILGEKDGWYHIRAKVLGKQIEGYSSAQYIKKTQSEVTAKPTASPTPTKTPSPTPTKTPTTPPKIPSNTPGYQIHVTGIVTASELDVWQDASEESESLGLLPNETQVTVAGVEETSEERFYYITAQADEKSYAGYVDSTHIQLQFPSGFYAKITEDVTVVTYAAGTKPVRLEDNSELTLSNQEVLLSNEDNVNDGKWFGITVTISGKNYSGYVPAQSVRLLGEKTSSETEPTKIPEQTTSYEMKLNLPAKVTSSTLNVRKDAGTSYEKVAQLNENDAVTIVGRKQNGSEFWYQINANSKGSTISGYVLSDYIEITFGSGFYGKLLNENTSLLKTAGTGGEKVTLADGSKLVLGPRQVWISGEKTAEGKKWFYAGVTISGTSYRGYVLADQVELLGKKVKVTQAPTPTPVPSQGEQTLSISGTVTAGTLNLRGKATTDSEKLASLTNQTKVTIIGEEDTSSGTWYQVEVTVNKKKLKGYVLSLYVTLDYSSPVSAVLTKTDVRPKVSIEKNASYVKNKDKNIISLKKGTTLTLQGEKTSGQEKWFLAKFQYGTNSYEGYILASEVDLGRESAAVTPTPSFTPTPTPTPTPSPTPTLTPTPTPSPSPTPTPTPILTTTKAVIKNAQALIIRSEPGYSGRVVCDNHGSPILLSSGFPVTLMKVTYEEDMLWYQVQFSWQSGSYTGYIAEEFLELQEDGNKITIPPQPPLTVTPTLTPIPTQNPINTSDFEAKLTAEGFPESYKTPLRILHQKYPNWEFHAYHTGLDWNSAVENESVVGKNLIPNSKGIEWKSLESGAYNWKTDSFIVYDGSTWVTASKEATAYYMDPRNFLDEKSIFQFEVLTYEPSYQNLEGVEGILQYTPMYQTSYNYVDEQGNQQTITYGETFIRAAEYSNVSPYHLASRVKQEVVTGTTTMSSSVSGTFNGWEGYYNFYNIGAYSSTTAGGAIANGLKYARNGSTNATLNANSFIPWNNRYRAIVGGAYIIGNSYISKGQDTIYLQKFNVTPSSTYSHQYMGNVEAPYSEGRKVYAGYTNVGELPIVFSIPVYLNMPETAVSIPQTKLNPNNWLKTLKVFDLSGTQITMTPAFDMTLDQEYYLVVDNSCDMIQIAAEAVNKKAVISGDSYYSLGVGTNSIRVLVVSESGDTRSYQLNVVRKE